MSAIKPKNLTAQLTHQAVGNPAASRLETTIANCFPGLETDFRNAWIYLFEGLEFQEATSTVLAVDDAQFAELVGTELVALEYQQDNGEIKRLPIVAKVDLEGTPQEGFYDPIEWSNALAEIIPLGGRQVTGIFRPVPLITTSSSPVAVTRLRDMANNYWYSEFTNRPQPVWIVMDLGESSVVTGVRLFPAENRGRFGDLSTQFPTDFRIQVADVNDNWSNAQTVLEVTNHVPQVGAWNDFTFAPVDCRFIRVYIPSTRWNERFQAFFVMFNEFGVMPEKYREQRVDLTVRNFFDNSHGETALISAAMGEPGSMTRGLCSPWQADYLECACFYWAASRPDYVNADSQQEGHYWLEKRRQQDQTGYYRQGRELIEYDDLYANWEEHLKFVQKAKDSE